MATTNDRVTTLLQGRRGRLARLLGRSLPSRAPDPTPLSEAVRTHLLEEAEELYLNEMEWEHLTSEDVIRTGEAPQETFAGFLAFIRGLLLEEALPDAKAEAEPRGAVVEDILRFLARRVVEIEDDLGGNDDEEEDRLRAGLGMTNRLIDLVLYEYHGLSDRDVERLEGSHAGR